MNIVAQDLVVRVALCGHEYRVPRGTPGRARKSCDVCAPPAAQPVKALNLGSGNRACVGCSEEFAIVYRSNRKWCSEKCRMSGYRDRNPGYFERNNELALRRYHENYVKASRELACTICGAEYTGVHERRLYCSKVCSNKAYAARRRADGRAADMSAKRKALELGVKIQAGRRMAVLEADNWICHLCEVPTNRDAVYPADDYPVIDHVVPLSKGGDHAPSNWKTAHSLCNMRKGDMSLAEFWEKFPVMEVA